MKSLCDVGCFRLISKLSKLCQMGREKMNKVGFIAQSTFNKDSHANETMQSERDRCYTYEYQIMSFLLVNTAQNPDEQKYCWKMGLFKRNH